MTPTTTTTIITGGNSGLGFHCARSIAAARPDTTVIIASRDAARVAAAVTRLRDAAPTCTVEGMTLDLAAFASIRAFVRAVEERALPPVGVLVCNAAVQVVTGTAYTADGIELTFGVNHLGHYLLTQLLLPRMAPQARIAFVSSDTHDPAANTGMPAPATVSAQALAFPDTVAAGADIADLGRQRYTTSKLCNLLCAYELARRLARTGSEIRVDAFNPGLMLDTGLVRDYSTRALLSLTTRQLFRFVPQMLRFRNSRKMGAALARLVLDETLAGVSGAYFDGYAQVPSSPMSHDEALAATLWHESRELCGLSATDAGL